MLGASELVKITKDASIPIRMVNPSAKPVKIYRRTRLADFEAVDQSIATFQLNDSVQLTCSTDNGELQSPQNDYSNLPDLADSVLNEDGRVKFQNLFRKHRHVFAFSDDQLGRTSLVQHVIDTGDAVPIKQRPYQTTPDNKQEIDRQVGEILKKGIIKESVSPWSSPVVLVRKKDGSMRFCADFRSISKITRKDSFPMPLVSETLDSLCGTRYFSTLDLKSGYWEIEHHPSAREKTAVATHNGLYEF